MHRTIQTGPTRFNILKNNYRNVLWSFNECNWWKSHPLQQHSTSFNKGSKKFKSAKGWWTKCCIRSTKGFIYLFGVILQVRVVFWKTVFSDWRFEYLRGSHLQSQVKSRRQRDYASGQDKGLSLSLSFNDEIRCSFLENYKDLNAYMILTPTNSYKFILGRPHLCILDYPKNYITSSVKFLLSNRLKTCFQKCFRL